MAQTTKKFVRFDSNDSVKPIPHILDMSPREISSLWLQRRDYASITASCLKAKHGMHSKSDECRGLESFVPGYALKTRQKIQESIKAVLKEQTNQASEKICCPERLAKVYKEKTSEPQEYARQIGLEDELRAKSAVQEISSETKQGTGLRRMKVAVRTLTSLLTFP